MIDDLDYHLTAWLEIVRGPGHEITYEKMKEECYGKNEELLERSAFVVKNIYNEMNYTLRGQIPYREVLSVR